MLGPYVDLIISLRRGNCKDINKVTGKHTNRLNGMMIKDFSCPKAMYIAAPKAIIRVAIERNKLTSPIINLFGREYRKSASAQRELRIDKNMNNEAEEENKESAFETVKMINGLFPEKIGNPFLALFPPGTVMAEANTTVAMSTAATVHDVAVSFNHCSPSEIKSLCSSVKIIAGTFSAEFSLTL